MPIKKEIIIAQKSLIYFTQNNKVSFILIKKKKLLYSFDLNKTNYKLLTSGFWCIIILIS